MSVNKQHPANVKSSSDASFGGRVTLDNEEHPLNE